MKKIVIFVPSIESGGVEKNLFIFLNFLKNYYKDIYLITSSKFNLKEIDKKIKIIIPKSSFWKNKNRLSKSIICSVLLIKYFFNKKILLISFQSNILSIILSKLLSWSVFIRLNTSPKKYINNFLKLFFFKFFYNLSDEVIVNSFEFSRDIKKIFNLKSKIILNPLKIKKFKYEKISFFKNFNGLKIVSIGRLTDQKDHFTLLKSVDYLIKKQKINLKLYIVGKGYKYKFLSEFIKRNSLKKYVKLAGYKKNAEKFLKNADLFILSSKFEGLPNVLLESQLAGVPIISSDCSSGPKEILLNGKLGILFKTGNYIDLYKKILIFNKFKKKYKKKAFLGKKYLFRFDYDSNLKKYKDLIDKKIN